MSSCEFCSDIQLTNFCTHWSPRVLGPRHKGDPRFQGIRDRVTVSTETSYDISEMSRWSLLPIVEIKYTGEYNRLFKVYNYKFLIKSGSVPSYFFATEGTQKRPDSVRTHYDLPLTFAFSSLLPHNIVSRPGLLAQSLGVTVNETNQTPSNRLERH